MKLIKEHGRRKLKLFSYDFAVIIIFYCYYFCGTVFIYNGFDFTKYILIATFLCWILLSADGNQKD